MKKLSLCKQVYKLLNPDVNSNKTVDYFLISLIIANMIAIILTSIESINSRYGFYFYIFEFFSIVIFTIEYLFRFWSIVADKKYSKYKTNFKKRLHFLYSPMSIIDLLAILPFYLPLLFGIDLIFLRVFRLFRLLKLIRYTKFLLDIFNDEKNNLISAFGIMLFFILISSMGIYIVEHKGQPEIFSSVLDSLWWSVVTLTTVGYGDTVPITLLGKIFAAFIMIIGVGLVALPTGIIASSFSKRNRSERKKLLKDINNIFFKQNIKISIKEQELLNKLSSQLNLSPDELHDIASDNISKNETHKCPHCGKKLSINS